MVQPLQLSGDLDMDLHRMRDCLEGKRQLYGGGLKDEFWQKRGLRTDELVGERSAFCTWLYTRPYGFFFDLHTEIQRAVDQSMVSDLVVAKI